MENKIHKIFERVFCADRIARKEAFDNVMALAETIATENPAGLTNLIRALLLPLQSEHMIGVAERSHHRAPSEIDRYKFFFRSRGLFEMSKLWVQPTPDIVMNLTRDVVLPTPWARRGYASALANIGNSKRNGAWKQDPNHVVSVWLPWRIGFVSGGNHSITAGVLTGEGTIRVEEVFDFSPVLAAVRCDGTHYRDCRTGKRIADVEDHRRAAVFEIGRILPATHASHVDTTTN